ncbi:PRC-barrel domain-containing protein [Methylocapsa sp. S129]|uniref:PRC-barrel domain-containing protein n=1 Tax=Methylocapsa sp. S129 TaxID=1641869 RepID=UPI00210F736A|nr:PRC-barrel domain-containing protein [Methylocapsa sp. S129]
MSRACIALCLVAFPLAFPHRVLAQAPASDSPPAATAPEAAKPPPATETPAVVADGNAAETLLGKPVQSAKGEDLGRIVDVIVDRTGTVRAAIIDFGGFLGVGTRKIAVDWHVLHFPQDGGMDKLIADLPRDRLRKAPVFKDGEPAVIMGRANAAPPPAPSSDAPGSSPVAPTTRPDTGSPAPKP